MGEAVQLSFVFTDGDLVAVVQPGGIVVHKPLPQTGKIHIIKAFYAFGRPGETDETSSTRAGIRRLRFCMTTDFGHWFCINARTGYFI